MNLFTIENYFVKFSFLLLFISMLSYWIETAFFFKKKNNFFGKMSMGLANIFLFCFLIIRWYESGHFPLSNLYESLIFLAWSLSVIHLYLEYKLENKLIGCLTTPTILLIQAFGTLSLPSEMQQPTALVPALQSNWLMMHVTLMILSYSALILGSLFSIGYLIVTRNIEQSSYFARSMPFATQSEFLLFFENAISNTDKNDFIRQSEILPTTLLGTDINSQSSKINNELTMDKKLSKTIELSKMFDNLSYRVLGIGFPLLTIGILSGAVWANEAWGSYWSWDPKETWALLTWLIFAIYLHTRFTKGWSGKKPALIASLGFVTVWICFLGVNLLGQGLHSYGWLTN